MRLTLSVLDRRGTGQHVRHVTIDAVCGSTFGEVRAGVLAAAGVSSHELSVAGRPVGDHDLLGRPPLVRGALLVSGPGEVESATRGTGGPGAVELRVVGGVGAGRVIVLGRGEHVVGRAASAGVRLDDPGVSRAHAILTVSADVIRLRDLEPTNPSLLEGAPLAPNGAPVTAGQHVRVGSTTFVVGPAQVRPGHHEVVDGEVRIHRQPRFRPAQAPSTVVFPEEPRRPDHGRLPLLASLAPLALSGVLALVLSSPALLLFALMSPVLLLGQWWSDRRAGRTSHRRRLKDHTARLALARMELQLAARADAARRRSDHPDLATVEAVVHRRGTRLWERRPADGDHLVLRIGTATQGADVTIEGPQDERPVIDDLPALVDLERSGVVGLAGPRDHVRSLAGALLVQLATWHTPRSVSLHVLTGSEDHRREWEWAAHLPHLADHDDHAGRVSGGAAAVAAHVAALRALVDSRRSARGSHAPGGEGRAADVVVLVDGASGLRSVPGLSELLREGPAAGIAVVCLDSDVVSLPAETQTSVELDGTRLSATLREDGRTLTGVMPDLPTPGWLETVSRAMAPYVDATPEVGAAALAARVSFVELHRSTGTDPASPEDLARTWSNSSGRAVALLGLAAEGPLSLDLAADGPHALVGGTTGSGKSELLQTLVTGLAVGSPPDELGFVLIDYKGGSAFSECSRLPHTVGLVTDLDAHLTSRALTSLGAEMKRRERLLARAGARDLDGYRRAAAVCRDLPPLARLVLVVDEFKALAEEFPDFVGGLVRVAALGRSLGLHLVLATQRPAGIVSADMRANIALRIALRVRDRSDSDDVVDSADAAALDPRAPGRACLRAGDQGLRTVQTAYLGGPLPTVVPGRGAVRVVARDLLAPLRPGDGWLDGHGHSDGTGWRDDASGADGSSGTDEAATELHAVVEAARAAARNLRLQPAPRPWLPPLPNLLTSAELSAAPKTDRSVGPHGPDGPDGPHAAADVAAHDLTGAAVGLADLPHEQRQEPLYWLPERDGHLGIAGGPRSGRSTTLVGLALGLACHHAPERLHVHVLQGARGPASGLAGLPHVGTVADATDPVTSRRLVARLLGLVDGEGQGPECVVVLVDGWESLEESLTATDHGRGIDDLLRLLRDGPSAGIWFAVAGGRALLSGRMPGFLQRRLVLAMPDPLDLTLAGVAPAETSAPLPPGRAIDLASGHHIQLAVPGTDATPAATAIATAHAVAADHARLSTRGLPLSLGGVEAQGPHGVARAPWRITALPTHVALEGIHRDRDHVVLGVGGDEAAPLGLPLQRGRRRFLVTGTARSGRSTTLATLGERLLQQDRPVLTVCPRRSPLGTWALARGVRALRPQDVAELVEVRRDDPDLCLLVDDVELVEGSPVEAPLLEAARLVDETDGVIAVSAELARANGAFRGLVPEVARDGCGIVLGASSPSDGDVLAARLDPSPVRRPGRGQLVRDGGALPIQVARLDPDQPLPTLAFGADEGERRRP